MRHLLITICLVLCLSGNLALAGEGGPTYQRNRSHGNRGFHGGGFYGQPNFGYGGYGGFFAPPIVVGSYYQRPYPSHFDYFRLRQRNFDAAPHAGCPTCGAAEVPVEVNP